MRKMVIKKGEVQCEFFYQFEQWLNSACDGVSLIYTEIGVLNVEFLWWRYPGGIKLEACTERI